MNRYILYDDYCDPFYFKAPDVARILKSNDNF